MSRANARSHAEVYLHIVWCTWDRHPLLTAERMPIVYRAILQECHALGCEVIAIGGMEDHVHLLVRVPPTVSPATLAKQVKGSSSHLANPEHGRRADFRWQRGYGVFSVSPQHVERIRRYVVNQEEHHRSESTADFLEPPPLDTEVTATEPAPQSAKGGLRAPPAAGFQPAEGADDAPGPSLHPHKLT
jgi:putative transposase